MMNGHLQSIASIEIMDIRPFSILCAHLNNEKRNQQNVFAQVDFICHGEHSFQVIHKSTGKLIVAPILSQACEILEESVQLSV